MLLHVAAILTVSVSVTLSDSLCLCLYLCVYVCCLHVSYLSPNPFCYVMRHQFGAGLGFSLDFRLPQLSVVLTTSLWVLYIHHPFSFSPFRLRLRVTMLCLQCCISCPGCGPCVRACLNNRYQRTKLNKIIYRLWRVRNGAQQKKMG